MENRSYRDILVRTVALIGLLLVLMLGAWGIILLAFNLPTIVGNIGGSITGLFTTSTTTVATTTAPVVVTKPTTTTVVTTKPTITYVPATTQPAQLYGYADLVVRILSVTPSQTYYSGSPRVDVKFEIENIGTNVAPAGWMFTANLPVGYSYMYSSPTQAALNPGDKVVYTLGFNTAYQNQYCTMQYPNTNCPWYQAPYQPYPYQGICYRYDGYQNTPVACPSDVNPNYDYYNNLNNGYNYQYGYGSGYNYSYYSGNRVTITVDPYNRVMEMNRANNTASMTSPLY